MKEYLINGKTKKIPTFFSDFSDKDWVFFFKLIHKNKYSALDIKMKFLKRFTNINFNKIDKLRRSKNVKFFDEYENHISKIQLLLEDMNFLDKKIVFDKCPLPKIRYNKFSLFSLYPPNDSLSNVKVWEMALTINYVKNYEASKNIEDINRFFGCVFRKSIPFWKILRTFNIKAFDRRVEFSDSLIDRYEKNAKNVPLHIKKLALAWFNDSYLAFTKKNKELFSSGDSKNDDDFTWADMILTAENSSPGDEKKISNSYAWLFMRRMVLQKRMSEKLRDKYKK